MKIKYPKERLEFEKFLKKLGYRNRTPVYKVKKINGLILEDEIGPIKVNGFFNLHKNKKSYLAYCYNEIIKDFRNNMSEEKIKKSIKMIAEHIDFKNNIHGRLGEVGWEVQMPHTIIRWNKSERTKLYVKILRSIKPLLENGLWDLDPKKGDILISRPGGLAFGSLGGRGDVNERPGRRRSKINQKFFNFGPTNSYGDQYAIYDENLKLNPIFI